MSFFKKTKPMNLSLITIPYFILIAFFPCLGKKIYASVSVNSDKQGSIETEYCVH